MTVICTIVGNLPMQGILMNKSLKQEEFEKLNDWEGWLKEFQNESDRATAILGAAFLDAKLEDLIKEFLVDDKKAVNNLLGTERPLGSFGSRNSVAYCLGLISKNQYEDINTIKKIRNKFAHNLHGLNFSRSDIRDICNNLITPKKHNYEPNNHTSRSHYIMAVMLISQWIHLFKLGIRDEKRKTKEEPQGSQG